MVGALIAILAHTAAIVHDVPSSECWPGDAVVVGVARVGFLGPLVMMAKAVLGLPAGQGGGSGKGLRSRYHDCSDQCRRSAEQSLLLRSLRCPIMIARHGVGGVGCPGECDGNTHRSHASEAVLWVLAAVMAGSWLLQLPP
ncbi:hypothetical protein VaNZ11_016861 [Volvox africanus]|uniref:Uncharacterized protein n=1 Tax=Volvox africanus TaxID=51714 RepID=A0ABQ5SNL3_9CHLO|nr:hypothetical protein VaNZ11_016861 [Volvox africanus]